MVAKLAFPPTQERIKGELSQVLRSATKPMAKHRSSANHSVIGLDTRKHNRIMMKKTTGDNTNAAA